MKYNPKYPVWGTPAAPVCMNMWDAEAWIRFAAPYRPKSYTGGPHDAEAWRHFEANREADTLASLRTEHGIPSKRCEACNDGHINGFGQWCPVCDCADDTCQCDNYEPCAACDGTGVISK